MSYLIDLSLPYLAGISRTGEIVYFWRLVFHLQSHHAFLLYVPRSFKVTNLATRTALKMNSLPLETFRDQKKKAILSFWPSDWLRCMKRPIGSLESIHISNVLIVSILLYNFRAYQDRLISSMLCVDIYASPSLCLDPPRHAFLRIQSQI